MSLSAPKILLTGVSGQVGFELMKSLQCVGTVSCFSRNPTFSQTQQSLVQKLDLSDFEEIKRIVRDLKPDVIVNPAAYTAVDRAESQQQEAMAINCEALKVLSEEAKKIDAAVVHFSTDYVFDGSGNMPWTEDQACKPINFYGDSKLEGERAVVESGVRHMIFRTSWVYGIHGHNFVKTMLKLGKERESLSVVSDQFGAPTSARLIAGVTASVLSKANGDFRSFCKDSGGIYHLTCQGVTSWHGFASQIFRLAKDAGLSLKLQELKPIQTEDYPTPAKRPKNSRINSSKLMNQFSLNLPPWDRELALNFEEIARSMV
jgi:dTDP-4-dehydrorhamnose reductase